MLEGVSSQVSPQGLGLLVAVVQTNQDIPVVFGPCSFHFVNMKIVNKLRLEKMEFKPILETKFVKKDLLYCLHKQLFCRNFKVQLYIEITSLSLTKFVCQSVCLCLSL